MIQKSRHLKSLNIKTMKRLFTLLVAIVLISGTFAQSPEKMSYQAVVRNSSNQLVTNQAIGMKISILQGSAMGSPVYVETQTPTSNINGLVTLEIGGGTVVSGTFSSIDWANGPYFLKTETDPTGGTNYTITGTNQLLSVPYALHAKLAENVKGGIAETDPVFVASPANEITTSNIDNWNSAYAWGDHSGLYRSATWVPVWEDVTNKPTFASVATSGSYNDLTSKPTLFSGNFNDLSNKPTTLSGYGITDADGSVTNELQVLSLAGTSLSLSNGGGTVILPSTIWKQNGSNIYFNTGNVGIGTTAPTAALHVSGQIRITGGTPAPGEVLTSDANGLATWELPSVKHYIGEQYGGGTVYYVYDNGQHGLIVGKKTLGEYSSLVNDRTAPWTAGIQEIYTLAKANGVGAGKTNTALIIASQGYGNGDIYAARLCNEYRVTENGVTYGDWYLPSIYELQKLYNVKGIVDPYIDGDLDWAFFSSTELHKDEVYIMGFAVGSTGADTKFQHCKVIAIRAF
jgi:hypothetical protein